VRVRLAAVALLVLALTACGGNGGTPAAKGCVTVDAPAPKADAGATKPTDLLDETVTYTLVFETSCGDFEITLDPESAPDTTASLVALAKTGFYDDTTFHRVVPGFVIQGGDPTGTGSGGPGYTTEDVPRPGTMYTRGVVAMAKSAVDPPGTSGSQFFVVTSEDAGLTAEYAVVGKVTKGYEAVERIEALGDAVTEQPTQPVVIERVSVRES
jgi:peptidyl-prolyl cis-trans isomerase B (cyclophilin B)